MQCRFRENTCTQCTVPRLTLQHQSRQTSRERLGSVYTKRRDCDCDVASNIAPNKMQCSGTVRLHQATRLRLRLRQWNRSQINGFATHFGAISLRVVPGFSCFSSVLYYF